MSESLPGNAPAAWRTVLTTIVVVGLQTIAFVVMVEHGDVSSNAATAFGALCLWSTTAAVGQAVKALGEHLGNGSGAKGALSALMSDTKPGDPAPEKQP